MKINRVPFVAIALISNLAIASDNEKCKAQYNNVIGSVELIASNDIPAPQADKEKAKLTLKKASRAAEQGHYCKAVQIIFE